ncbi:MAG: Na(+)/H(+) antiporter subunit D [Balneolaceae bacterium]
MITELLFFPAVLVLLGALVLPLAKQEMRPSLFLVFPLAALATIWIMPDGFTIKTSLANYELILVQANSLSRIFGTIFAMIAVIGGVFAWHIKDLGQQSSALAYGAGALGVTFAGDFFTLLVFWELMAVSSTYLIWAHRTAVSQHSGMRYLVYHSLGGGILLTGILTHLNDTGSILLSSFPETFTLASLLILIGVAINAAIPPLSAWLPDAYPNSTITGAVFMSAFTTKSAVYVLMILFPGWSILIWLGVAMAIYGTVYAILSNDIRQILAYSIISQIGYMVTGIGIGTEMALNGAAVHAFSHILYKCLLFMAAGGVLYATGKSKLSELGGFASKMKWVVGLYIIGALSISGFPLFNGFISKSMIVSAAGSAHYEWVYLLLTLASVGTFLHTGLKLPYFTWFGKQKSEFTVKPVPKNMIFAMGIGAFLCTLFGVWPQLLYNYLPFPVDYHPYTVYHLVEVTQILIFTFIGFWIFRTKLDGNPKIVLDTDWFYRKPAAFTRTILVNKVDDFFGLAERVVHGIAGHLASRFDNPMAWLNPFSTEENNARSYSSPAGTVMAFILFAFLVFSLYLIT